MKGFINLTLRTERTSIAINPEHIIAIQDLRTDPSIKDQPEWQYSVIMTNGNRFYVKETYEEICYLIRELLL
jgi:uncharacterized protein YlzI (FlbEa/FlbD family)